MLKKVFIFLLGFSFVFANNQVMIILDASKNMLKKVDQKEKISIIKDSLSKVINVLDANSQIGLMAYGHRNKWDCSDIEVLVPIKNIDKKELLQKLKDILPKGKASIGNSLQKVANRLNLTKNRVSLILISGGKDTCDIDPCKAAKELAKIGIDFTIYVIGFDVDLQTDKQLKCVADSTKGDYFSVKSGLDMTNVLKNVVKKAKELKYNLEVRVSESNDSKFVKSEHEIFKFKNNKEEYIKSCSSSNKNPCLQKLFEGDYLLKTFYNEFKIDTNFTIKPNKKIVLNIISGQTGEVEINLLDSNDSKFLNAEHEIFKFKNSKEEYIASCSSNKGEICFKKLPIGNYLLKTFYDESEVEIEFTIKANQITILNVKLD